jgi:uncharacterized protein YbjT (DUF2867 family)
LLRLKKLPATNRRNCIPQASVTAFGEHMDLPFHVRGSFEVIQCQRMKPKDIRKILKNPVDKPGIAGRRYHLGGSQVGNLEERARALRKTNILRQWVGIEVVCAGSSLYGGRHASQVRSNMLQNGKPNTVAFRGPGKIVVFLRVPRISKNVI